jgi:hypothetical protein
MWRLHGIRLQSLVGIREVVYTLQNLMFAFLLAAKIKTCSTIHNCGKHDACAFSRNLTTAIGILIPMLYFVCLNSNSSWQCTHTHTHTSLILFPPQSFPAAGTIIDLTNLSAPKTGKVLKRYILFRLRRLAIASSSSTTPHSSWREETRRQEYIQIPTFTIELGDFDFLFCACTIVIAR